MKRLFFSLAFSLSLFTWFNPQTDAQEFKAPYPGKGVVTVKGDWRFHTGDDLAWKDPKLDDTAPAAGWETITADEPWGAQTHPGYTGFAWYRRAIEIDGVKGPISIAMPPVDDVYELYWNGEKIGGYGSLPPHASWRLRNYADVFSLPRPDAEGRLKGVLAVRVWKSMFGTLDRNDSGGLNGPPAIGDSKLLEDRLQLADVKYERARLILIVLYVFFAVIGGFSLGLWAINRRRRLNLWLGVFLLCSACTVVAAFPDFQRSVDYGWHQLYLQLYDAGVDIGVWMLVLTLFGLDRDRLWRRTTAIFVAVYLISDAVDAVAYFFWSSGRPVLQVIDGVTTAIYSMLPLYLFVLVAAGLRRRRDLALLPMALACVALETYNLVTGALEQFKRFTHIDFPALIAGAAIHLGPYVVTLKTQLGIATLVVMVWTVFRQQALERRQQTALLAEVKSAREVQQVLVPESVAPVEGFAISSLYWPAEEVGGDMFQVLPGDAGDVLIVLADVSGKGLKAAMTVSLIVGTIRTLADYTMDPVEILNGLNRRLIGRTSGGFATCVVLHVSATGEVAMGNAGHLAPFLNGEEMSVPGSLPLGLVPEATFDAVRFHLQQDDEITLYTDGVLEAQNAKDEMYGFDRTAALMRSRPTVRAIAEAAKNFGQSDDISVVKLVRVAADDTRERMSVDLKTVDMTMPSRELTPV
jgi:Stage II sporulation protein E (SpoIIE)